MIELALYLICVGMVLIGALGMIRALSIPGRTRMVLACLAAAVPVGAGIWLFHSSGLRLGDLDRLMRNASAEVQQAVQSLKDAKSFQGKGDLKELLEQVQ